MLNRLKPPRADEQGAVRGLARFFADEAGATAIEYALISALIAIVLVTALTNLGTRLSAEFSEISSALK